MQRYFFDIRQGARTIDDKEGLLLSDADAACREAARTLGNLILQDPPGRKVCIEVRDELGALLRAEASIQIIRKN